MTRTYLLSMELIPAVCPINVSVHSLVFRSHICTNKIVYTTYNEEKESTLIVKSQDPEINKSPFMMRQVTQSVWPYKVLTLHRVVSQLLSKAIRKYYINKKYILTKWRYTCLCLYPESQETSIFSTAASCISASPPLIRVFDEGDSIFSGPSNIISKSLFFMCLCFSGISKSLHIAHVCSSTLPHVYLNAHCHTTSAWLIS